MDLKFVSRLTWLLPVTTLVALVYVAGGIYLGINGIVPIWLLLILAVPGILLTWVALIIAFIDVTERAKSEISTEAGMVWLVMLIIGNILAFIPYWLMVARRGRTTTSVPGR